MDNHKVGDKNKIMAERADSSDYETKLKSIADMSKEEIDNWVTSNPTQTVLLQLARVVWALTKVVLKIWKNL